MLGTLCTLWMCLKKPFILTLLKVIVSYCSKSIWVKKLSFLFLKIFSILQFTDSNVIIKTYLKNEIKYTFLLINAAVFMCLSYLISLLKCENKIVWQNIVVIYILKTLGTKFLSMWQTSGSFIKMLNSHQIF